MEEKGVRALGHNEGLVDVKGVEYYIQQGEERGMNVVKDKIKRNNKNRIKYEQSQLNRLREKKH